MVPRDDGRSRLNKRVVDAGQQLHEESASGTDLLSRSGDFFDPVASAEARQLLQAQVLDTARKYSLFLYDLEIDLNLIVILFMVSCLHRCLAFVLIRLCSFFLPGVEYQYICSSFHLADGRYCC